MGAHFDPTAAAGKIALGRGDTHHDFDAVMIMVFHETTHHYQQVLADRAKAQQATVFPSQIAIFGANINAYVSSSEDQVIYREQPIEAHAYIAGGHAAGLMARGLERLEAS